MSTDPLDHLARVYLSERLGSAFRSPEARAVERWAGVPVAYTNRADGAVSATYLGLTGVGQTPPAALVALDRQVRAGQIEFVLTPVAGPGAGRAWA